MLPVAIRKRLLQDMKAQFRLDIGGIHGAPHWARVRANGLRLAKTTGADTTVIELFAYIHDSQRVSDGPEDTEHGPRAASFAFKLDYLHDHVTLAQMRQLHVACSGHTSGMPPMLDATVATCWDADRLDIGRVGLLPDERYFSTIDAKGMIYWAYERSIR